MNEKPLLVLEHISYSYPDGPQALNDVSATITAGERIVVLGNNGAGKSTFFLTCNGILRPDRGKIIFRERELTYKKADLLELRKSVGMIFQDAENQLIASTVLGEISFGPINLGLSRQQVAQRVEDALNQLQITELRNRPPHYLSGGEKKRVSIADILAMQPQIILFDEPTASLDPQNVVLLEKILQQLTESGIAIVISTHDVDFAYRFGRRAIVFHQGKIIADGEIDQVFANDQVIRQAALQKPLLYQAAQLLCSSCSMFLPPHMPRNPEEFAQLIAEMKLNLK
ncbi:MAG: ABC transporter ATP-binding protein [Clostridiales bacterium]